VHAPEENSPQKGVSEALDELTVQQYVGRLHRLHDQKKEVVVYDYVDGCVPMMAAMFDKRQRGYESVGYSIAQNRLF